MFKRIALAALAVALPFSAVAAPRDDTGKLLWVIAGVAEKGNDALTMSTYRGARHCGVSDARIEDSSDFDGMKPGFQLVVVGPYTIRAAQTATLEAVRECLPNAYGINVRSRVGD